MKKQYFCNPLNMDYRYQFIQDMRSGEDKISREAADPSMILKKRELFRFRFLFSVQELTIHP